MSERSEPPRCGCAFAWRRYDVELYGVDMGEAWQMIQRHPECPREANHGRPWPGARRPVRALRYPAGGVR